MSDSTYDRDGGGGDGTGIRERGVEGEAGWEVGGGGFGVPEGARTEIELLVREFPDVEEILGRMQRSLKEDKWQSVK